MPTTALAERPTDVLTVTTDQLDLICRTIAKDATPDELRLYLFDCHRQGVHPLDKLIHFTKRSGKYTPITSIDFMRIRAADSGEMAGSDDVDFEFGDENPDLPTAATVTVYRLTQGQRFAYTATARWREYKPETNDFMWRKMPCTMLAKCAEALALRKGFPRQLAGLYAKEEMDQSDGPAVVESPVRRAAVAPAADVSTGEASSVPNEGDSGVDPTTGEEFPPGFHLIDDYRPDGDWHHISWGRDAQGGSMVFKTKLRKVADAARVAYNDRVPVRLHCKKAPLLDKVERLDAVPPEPAVPDWPPADPEAHEAF
jgi:phage recombination protein Bet